MALAVRDIKLRYRQTMLGVLWVILQPLLAAGVFAFIFGRVAHLDSAGEPYVLFSYMGLLVWNLFNNSITKAGSALVANAALVSKIFFPRMLLPFSAIISSGLDFLIGLAVGFILMLLYGNMPGATLFVAPFWLGLLILFSAGLGLISAALAVAYRDVLHVLPVTLQLLLYGSPVAYTISVIPAGLPRTIYRLNPLVPMIEGFRNAMLGHGFIGFNSAAYGIFAAVTVFVGGLLFFRRMERQFADVI
ncbi:MAG TPA: ABC transporter permease [Chthoniobacteraceae bacterium]